MMDLKEEAVRNIRDVAARVLKPKGNPAPTLKAPGKTQLDGVGNVVGSDNVVVIVQAPGGMAPSNQSTVHDEKWRKRRIARILAICKELGRAKQLDRLLATAYGATILIELADDQLNDVFRLVSTWH